MTIDLDKLASLCKRRGFIFQSSEIYGGLASTWDYGPLGAELKRNVKDAWWRSMVLERDDMVGLDSAIIMHPEVWKASGHVESFTDPLVECVVCHRRWREDQLPPVVPTEVAPSPLTGEGWGEGETSADPVCPECEGKLTPPRMFNLMFETHMGPVRSEENVVHLRPETAQGIFVNFANVVNYSELATLMAPRPFMVERGHSDGVAPDEWVAYEFAKVRRFYNRIGLGDRAEIEFFDGPHEIHGKGTFQFLRKHLDWE